MWQWRQSSNEDWQAYSDIENSIIETAHQRGNQQVELDNGVIVNLKKHRHQSAELRRVSRESAETTRQRRTDRFCSAPVLAVKETSDSSNVPFGAADWIGSNFVFEWHMRCYDLESRSYGEILREALQGLQHEGNRLGHQQESQWIVDELLPVTKQSFEKIGQACVRLYTMESFVYSLINRTLRDNDLSKVDTLGAFCYLLFQFTTAPEFQSYRFTGCVYRGANLSASQVSEYERAVGSVRSWLGFTSTSRQRKIVESFGDSTVLFIIDIQESAYCSARHIAQLSIYPQEDEVFIRAGRNFTINRVEHLPVPTNQIRTLISLSIE